jgi:thiamine-phosphate pyrophosphorylase
MTERPKKADPRPRPRLYLVTPRLVDVDAFAAPLAQALAAGDVAAVLLRLAPADERSLINRAKQLAPLVQQKDVALILDGHADLVARTGADGAHLSGTSALIDALAALKPERIAGVGALATRHDAMLAAETGADYVMFGDPDAAPAADAVAAVEERVAWWAEVFELPCVGYAGAPDEVAALAAAGADFVALGDWLWREPQSVTAQVAAAALALAVPETAA